MPSAEVQQHSSSRIHAGRLVAFLLGLPAYFAACMFWPAGDWAWTRGWLFLATSMGAMAVAALCLWRVNPEVLVVRTGIHPGTKRWDSILLKFFFPAVYAIIPVAALDAGRFHWHPLGWRVCGAGYLLFLAGFALVAWAEAVNKFFEVTVRIQTERNHVVVDSGPYAFVRHPGYAGGMILFAGMALSLGSLWALIPAGLASALLLLRLHWEDQTLQAELPGYQEYARRVRSRLFPGIW